MSQTKTANLNIRVPGYVKEGMTSLSNLAGVSVSELFRMFIERDLFLDAGASVRFARAIGEARNGWEYTAGGEKLERVRLEMILNGSASGTEEGGIESTSHLSLEEMQVRALGIEGMTRDMYRALRDAMDGRPLAARRREREEGKDEQDTQPLPSLATPTTRG